MSSTAASDEAWLASYTESTRAAYARALNRYRGWCEAQSVGAEGITIRELERFLAFAASEWGSEPARIASVAIRGRGLVGAEPHRFAPGHRSDRRLDQHRAPVPARERVREASSAAWTLGIVEWALVELLVQTGRSLPQLCRLEGRDLRWCSWAPDGVILIRDLRTKRIVVYGAGEDLFTVLRSLHSGERARLLRESDGRPLRPSVARTMLQRVAQEAGLDRPVLLQGLRAFSREMDRRLADHLGITYTYLQKYRWGDHDTLPLDSPPDPPDEDFAAFLEGMKLNARRARASA